MYLRSIILIISAALTAVVMYYMSSHNEDSHNNEKSNAKSFVDLLPEYGFKSPEQQQAIENLLHHASIISPDRTLSEFFPKRTNKEDLVRDVLYFLKETQAKFVIRRGTQERWEVKGLAWMEQNKNQILADLKALGYVYTIQPKRLIFCAFCVLGGTLPRMKGRIDYVTKLLESGFAANHIILLAGERYTTKDVDGSKEELKKIAEEQNLQDWTKLTETHLITHAYNHSELAQKNIAHHVIDTPRGNLPRPTTQTTILELIKWLQTHKDIKHIVFVSNQPQTSYQKAVIDNIFKEQKTDITYEVVGEEPQSIESLQPLIEGLGTYIWAATPAVLADMDFKSSSPTIQADLHDLYAKNPLMYSTLPTALTK